MAAGLKQHARYLLGSVLVFAAYAGSARLGLTLHAVGGFATLIWAPTGIALAAVLLFGNAIWPAVALAALVANLLTGASPLVAVPIALGNAGEALLGAYLLQRVGFVRSLERVRDVLALIGLAAVVSPALSATVGVGSLWAGGKLATGELAATWQTWWAGDALGAGVVAPLLLTWSARRKLEVTPRRLLELGALLGVAAGVVELVFVEAGSHPLGQPYLVYPVLIWAALRFGPRGAATAIFAISAIAIGLTAQGLGPFVATTLTQSLLAQQGFMASTAVTVLLLAAAGTERIHAIRVRDDFLAVAAHELRTPAAALQMHVRRLQRVAAKSEPVSNAELGARAEKIFEQLRRFNALIENLLDVTRLTQGRLAFATEELELSQLVREVAARLEDQAVRAGSRIVLSGDSGPLGGQWDRLRVDQIVTNLLTNALKYGAGRPVEVCLSADEGSARVAVKDHGIGIEAEHHERIFERFERAASPRHFGGLGLGLWIVKELAHGMGGKITVVSSPGEGSTFTLWLPRPAPPRGASPSRRSAS